jgi:hypothetical protein
MAGGSLFGELLILDSGSGTIVFVSVMIFLTVFEGGKISE